MDTYNEMDSAYTQNMFAHDKKESLLELIRPLEDKNVTGDGEKNLYHLAARYFDYQVIACLVEEGVKPHADEYGNTPLHAVTESPYGNDNTNFQKMEEAIYRTVKKLIDAGVNPKKKNDNGVIAYMDAGKAGMYPFIKAVAEAGVKMDAVGEEGKNLLHIIADGLYHRKTVEGVKDNAYKTIKLLLESGSPDPEDKDIFDKDALYYAQQSGVKEVAALLSGNESAIATGGMTLTRAVMNNDNEAVEALLAGGAPPDEIEEQERTPLMWACEYPRPEIVKLLLKYKANPNYVTGQADITAMTCLLTRSAENLGRGFKGGNQPPKDIRNILRMLLDAGVDPNAPLDGNGNTALIYVAGMDYFAGLNNTLAEELINSGADVNKANLNGQTPLMLFAVKGDEQEHNIAELLLDNNADTSLVDSDSNTALMYAAFNTNKTSGKKIAALILDAGYTALDCTNNAGQTAMDIAISNENEAMVKLLASHM